MRVLVGRHLAHAASVIRVLVVDMTLARAVRG